MNLFYQADIPSGANTLDAEESRHCVRVLRKKSGDHIRITDGKGTLYHAVITKDDPHQCAFRIEKTETEPLPSHSIHIAIAPTKNADRIEWFVEKAVELGISEITPMTCHNSERGGMKIHRLEKVVLSAMKQSLKVRLPVVHPLTDFEQVISLSSDSRFIAYVDSENPDHLLHVARPRQRYLVLIGPEGDFTIDELNAARSAGFQRISLGKSRLRTETAGLVACHILNLVNTEGARWLD